MEWLFRILEAPICRLSERSPFDRPTASGPETRGLGRDLDSGEPFAITASDLKRHAYILGATGCGKTTLILKLIRQDIAAGHTTVIVDMRGDLVTGVLGLCRELGTPPENVVLLDLRERERPQTFNPLGGAGEPYVRALHVLDVVASEAESWGVQLEETLRSALLLLAVAKRPLTDLERLFGDDRFRGDCLSIAADEGLAAFWDRYEALSPEKRIAWTLPVLNKVSSLLAVPVLRHVLGGRPSLDLGKELGSKGHVLLVSLAVDELHRSSRMLGSLFVSAVAREMMARVNVPERDRNPVRLYVDEFENMASESFEGLIAEGRRFGLTLVLSHQTLAQLPARLRSVVRNNVGIQLIFQCGFEDAGELARELPEDVKPVDLRALGTGEAYAMSRDGEAVKVRFHAPGASPHPSAVAAYRARVLFRLPDVRRATVSPSAPTFGESGSAVDLEEWL